MFDTLIKQIAIIKKIFNYTGLYHDEQEIINIDAPTYIKNMIDDNSEIKLLGEYNIEERVLVLDRDYVSTIPTKLIGENVPTNYCLYNSVAWVQDSSREDLPYPNHSTIERFLTLTAWGDTEFNNKLGQITMMALYKNDTGSELISNTVQQYNILGSDGIFKNYLINNFLLDFSSYPMRQLYFIGPKN